MGRRHKKHRDRTELCNRLTPWSMVIASVAMIYRQEYIIEREGECRTHVYYCSTTLRKVTHPHNDIHEGSTRCYTSFGGTVVGSGEPQRHSWALLVQLQGQPQCSQLHIRYYVIDYFSQSCASSATLSLSLYYTLLLIHIAI